MNSTPQIPEIGQTIELPNLKVNYQVAGDPDAPALLLIHGSGPGVTAWANWRLIIPELAKNWRVIAPDMAGFGYTDVKGDGVPDRTVWLQQLTGLLDALNVSRVSVIGNSFGGALALALATAHPERVRKLILMGPVGLNFPLTEGLDRVWGYRPSLSAMRQLLEVFVYDRSGITEDLVEMRFRASTREGVQERYAALFPAPRQRWIEALASSPAQLATLNLPTLIVHGRNDEVIPLEASERLQRTLPAARLHIVENCGHWVQIEHTDEFLKAVRAFLQSPMQAIESIKEEG